MKKSSIFTDIESVINSLNTASISSERKEILQNLIVYIQLKVVSKEQIRINFICTHNSRRSHLSQVWAQTMATYFGIDNVFCYSGGTESTALFPMAAKTLQNSGFKIQQLFEGKNPVYAIKYAENEHPIIGFSKKMDDDFNPRNQFVAIMTCDSANEACPFVPGAEKRIPIMFLDPKAFDNTPQQAEKYQERSLQIATELKFVFENINL